MSETGWTKRQAQQFVKILMDRIGWSAWQFMVPEVREAMVARECLSMVRHQVSATVGVKDVERLLQNMRDAAGLES